MIAQKVFGGNAAHIVHALYRINQPVGFGELVEEMRTASGSHSKQIVSTPTVSRQLRFLEEVGVVEALTRRPPGERHGVAVLYQVRRQRVDELIDSYARWIRNIGEAPAN